MLGKESSIVRTGKVRVKRVRVFRRRVNELFQIQCVARGEENTSCLTLAAQFLSVRRIKVSDFPSAYEQITASLF